MFSVSGDCFAVREVTPTLRFAKPLPTMLSIERGSMAAQQFHFATTHH
jgi:hypothetical protein